MFVLVIVLIFLIPNDGQSSEPDVYIFPLKDFNYPIGARFNLSCAFTFLTSEHSAMMWRGVGKNKESLIKVTSTGPNVNVTLNINFATAADAGRYSCGTDPPVVISQLVNIKVNESRKQPDAVSTDSGQETARVQERLTGRLSTLPTMTEPSSPEVTGRVQPSCKAGGDSDCSVFGLQGQMWYWMLMGKATLLLFSVVSLGVKYKRG